MCSAADALCLLCLQVGEQDEKEGREYRPVVMFNQRLSSGDVGLGLNARRLRESFLRNFVITYSLRSIGDVGSVFRRYPGLWKVCGRCSTSCSGVCLHGSTPGVPCRAGPSYGMRMRAKGYGMQVCAQKSIVLNWTRVPPCSPARVRVYCVCLQVFVEEADMPGRYKLIAEQPSRPQGMPQRHELLATALKTFCLLSCARRCGTRHEGDRLWQFN